MGIFGQTPQSETDVEKATDENNTKEEWGLIIEICDKVGKSSTDAKEYLKAILKRISHNDPHVATQAVTLLDACVKNCGHVFHVEVASHYFETEYRKLLKRTHPHVSKKLRDSLKKWAEGEFKSNPQLNLIPTLYAQLRSSGVDFSATDEQPKRVATTLSKDPNVVQSQEEEDQIAKAIELSLKETSSSPRSQAVASSSAPAASAAPSSLYPNMNFTNVKEPRKVRALYDFEAAEDNELTFNSGEIIFIIDDSDPNWWKGNNQRGEGLFPANFVTSDLSMDPDQLMHEKKKKLDELDESLDKQFDDIKEPEHIEIDELKIDRLLHLLHEADPTSPENDSKDMLSLEKEVNSMGGLIDKELEKVDRKHAQLTQLSSDLVEALNLYHSLMREPSFSSLPLKGQYAPYSQPPPNSMMYNGTLPHQPPPNLGPPPSLMTGYNTLPHDRYNLPPPPGSNMPPSGTQGMPGTSGLPPPPGAPGAGCPPPGQSGPRYSTLPIHMVPPGHLPPPTGMQRGPPPNSLPPQQQPPPMSAPPQSMPPLNLPPMSLDDPRLTQTGHFPPPAAFQSGNYPPPPPHLQQNGAGQIPQTGSYSLPPPTTNTHIM